MLCRIELHVHETVDFKQKEKNRVDKKKKKSLRMKLKKES